MNPRTTVGLFFVAAALSAFTYFYVIRGEEARQEAEEAAKRLFPGVEEEAIDSISLTTADDRSARLERGLGGWSVAEPVVFPADAFAADAMAAALSQITSEAVLEDPQPPEEYGLGEDASVIRFQAGETTHELRLGNATPVGSNTYAATGSAEAVYTVPSFRAGAFRKSLDDLREKQILDFDRTAIRRIEARWPEGFVTLERDSDGVPDADDEDAEEGEEEAAEWRLTAPVQARADARTVEDLLSDLAYLRANGFVDDPPEGSEAGFEPPAFQVLLSGLGGESDEPVRVSMSVGGFHGDAERLVRAAQPALYTIPADRLADLPRALIDYRYKTLSKFPLTAAQRLDFFFHPEVGDPVAITATRGDSGWSTSPEATAPGRVARLVSELSGLTASDILFEEADAERLRSLGLSPPVTILSVFGAEPPEGETASEGETPAGAPKLAEIQLGRVLGDEGIVARAAGDPTVYRLDLALAEHIPVSLEAFRNRFRSEEQPETVGDAEASEADWLLSPSQESP